MAENFQTLTYLFFFFSYIMTCSISESRPWTGNYKFQLPIISNQLRSDPQTIQSAATDYGNIVHQKPSAVLFPSSVQDIAALISNSNKQDSIYRAVAAKGRAHSVRGQAMAQQGVVVDMMELKKSRNGQGVVVSGNANSGFYADVGGEQLWLDVLSETNKRGFSPVSWTDYLNITVGGTLSNAGISGQTHRFGPQISNVFEMDVITGKGEFVTCSAKNNPELFYAVLGGLGQFGIITRARIPLQPAPNRAKWVRLLYSDFAAFTKDQEQLISINGGVNYLEGSLLLDQGPPDPTFFSPSDIPRISALVKQNRIIYSIELAMYYDDRTKATVQEELQALLKGLSFIPGFNFEKDVSYVEFIGRVQIGDQNLNEAHPWLNLFIPKSRVLDFDAGVFKEIVLKSNLTQGLVLLYPMNKSKWDDRMSAMTPDEEIFYTVGFLHTSGVGDWQAFDDLNKEILEFCDGAGIKVKQYLPNHATKQEWIDHFGPKWGVFQERKTSFDPRMILSPGQRIFNNN
ncbi:cytokinin dehydrogenase 3 [Tripterygium wilfordii]|uniref:cytokinin dehydrogenase n=1 Tax=Tripterygium wilfordii TaxID=458696 RepID=A0A7J7D9W0_TRIWF|nr:cytokinin dehydrogenase 3-like [Tripterygium wilfordii]KAF5743058.1 cytokinin dehydrogenase 3 [Tripterygium wilfordii]